MRKILLLFVFLLIIANSVSAIWCAEGQWRDWDSQAGDWVYGPEVWVEIEDHHLNDPDNYGDIGLASCT